MEISDKLIVEKQQIAKYAEELRNKLKREEEEKTNLVFIY